MDETPLKRCYKCRHWKSHEAFGRDASKRDGLRSRCRPCEAEASRRYREDNLETELERNRRYREANHEADLERKRLYREANREAVRESDRRYKEENREVVREYDRRRRQTPKRKADNRRHNAKRRAQKKEAAISDFSTEDLLHRLEEVYDNRCAYCGCCISEGYHWDHVQPLSKDGAHALENLAPACPRCNLSKHAKPVRAWIGPHLARLEREIRGHHEDRSRGRTSESKSAWARSEAGRASGRERGRRRRQRMRGVAPSGPPADEGT